RGPGRTAGGPPGPGRGDRACSSLRNVVPGAVQTDPLLGQLPETRHIAGTGHLHRIIKEKRCDAAVLGRALLPTPLDRGPVERRGPRSRPVVLQGPRRAVAGAQVAVSLGLVALDEGLPAFQRPLLQRGPAATGSPARGRGRTGSQR